MKLAVVIGAESWKFLEFLISLGKALKTFNNIGDESGMDEIFVRYIKIEVALRVDIKSTMIHNKNQSYNELFGL